MTTTISANPLDSILKSVVERENAQLAADTLRKQQEAEERQKRTDARLERERQEEAERWRATVRSVILGFMNALANSALRSEWSSTGHQGRQGLRRRPRLPDRRARASRPQARTQARRPVEVRLRHVPELQYHLPDALLRTAPGVVQAALHKDGRRSGQPALGQNKTKHTPQDVLLKTRLQAEEPLVSTRGFSLS
ncbi:MAG: hypothetical protein JWO54_422 [Candidatus Saccharibacteria bacterium]|nr:hypothetical protein [Candidatus Saccharibacteria bacterium]